LEDICIPDGVWNEIYINDLIQSSQSHGPGKRGRLQSIRLSSRGRRTF
jgi:hypothetical protein